MSAKRRYRYVYIRMGLRGAAIMDRRRLRGNKLFQALSAGVYIKADMEMIGVRDIICNLATEDSHRHYTLNIPPTVPGTTRILVTETYPVTESDWRYVADLCRLIQTKGEDFGHKKEIIPPLPPGAKPYLNNHICPGS